MQGEHAGIGPVDKDPFLRREASRAGGCFLHSFSRRFKARGGTANGGEFGQRPHSEQSKFVNMQSVSPGLPIHKMKHSSQDKREETGEVAGARGKHEGSARRQDSINTAAPHVTKAKKRLGP